MKVQRILTLFSFFLVVISCQDYQPEPLLDGNLTVSEVRNHFDRIGAGQRIRTPYTPYIQWDSARLKEISIGESLVFPVEFDQDFYLSATDSTKGYSAQYATYAIAYKLEDSIHLEFVEFVPTSNSSLFSGHILVRDWNDAPKRVLVYEDGNLVGDLAKDGEASSRGRSVCYETYTWYCTVRPGADDCELVAYEFYCEQPQSLIGPDPIDYNPGGGPGGPGGSQCEHPGIPGYMVPCEDLITCPGVDYEIWEDGCVRKCDEGFVRDSYGNCVPREEPCNNDPLIDMVISTYNIGKNSNRFGCTRVDPDKICEGQIGIRRHAGIDLQASIGTPVFSISAGTVFATVADNKSFGNYIIIKSQSLYFLYAHLKEKPNISGDVSIGDFIGYSGESATVGKPHLHLEVRQQQNTEAYNSMDPVNIEDYLSTKFDNNGDTISNDDCN